MAGEPHDWMVMAKVLGMPDASSTAIFHQWLLDRVPSNK